MDWLLSSIDVSRPHSIEIWAAWHGRLMFFSWGVLIPLGIFVARYFKVTPKQNWPVELDNKFWWYTHVYVQVTAYFLALSGLILILVFSMQTIEHSWHGLLGWIVMCLGGLQLVLGIFRGSKGGPEEAKRTGILRGDHYDMTPRRKFFEAVHMFFGYAAILIGVTTILSGLWFVNAPRWMWIIAAFIWLGLLVASISQERLAKYKKSYQAIWGLDPNHPGSQK